MPHEVDGLHVYRKLANTTNINWPAAMGDWNASLALTAGVLAALARKDRTGEGDKVTVTLHHAALWPMQMMLGGTQFGDKWPKSRYNVTCLLTTPIKPKMVSGSSSAMAVTTFSMTIPCALLA